MTREPDRFEAILADWERRFNSPASRRSMFDRADLLAYFRQAADEALERAAQSFQGNVTGRFGGPEIASLLRYLKSPAAAPAAETGKTERQTCVPCQGTGRKQGGGGWGLCPDCNGHGFVTVAQPLGPVAPERAVILRRYSPESGSGNVTPCRHCRRFFHQHMRDDQDVGWCVQPIAAPVAPSLLPRVLAALNAAGMGVILDREECRAIAAELRRYIERMSNNG